MNRTHGHVTSLQLSLGLAKTISLAIGSLMYLELLNLNRNQLFESILSNIDRLLHLMYLDLYDNGDINWKVPNNLTTTTVASGGRYRTTTTAPARASDCFCLSKSKRM